LPAIDVTNMASIAERGTIISATLAVLTFTYASCFENPVKKHITKIGEYFLESTLLFLVGIIFLTGFGETVIKGNPVVSNSVFIFFIFIVLTLVISICFFVIGISDLLKQLFWKEDDIEELKERI
jgi:thiamine transporter ThiT